MEGTRRRLSSPGTLSAAFKDGMRRGNRRSQKSLARTRLGSALARLVADTFESASLPGPDQGMVAKAIDALVGLAAFPAEQVLSMSLSKNGLDLERLWERKRQAIEQTPGLTVW